MGNRIKYTKGQRLYKQSRLKFNKNLQDHIQPSGQSKRRALFDCDCGGQHESLIYSVKSGITLQCNDCHIATTHGMYESPLYDVWRNMKQRCDNPKHPKYYDYGGRGITYITEWKRFEPFMKWSMDNGWNPNKVLELDREDNSLNYTPDNCRYITPKKNCQNQYKSKWWIVDGVIFESKTDAADSLGISHETVRVWCDGLHKGDKFYPPRPNCKSVHKYINEVKQPYPTVT